MFHRGGRSTDRTANYSNDSGFNHGPATNSDGVEVNDFYYVYANKNQEYLFIDLEFNRENKKSRDTSLYL